ncbi:MAG: hypothetical protein QOG68_1581 [Solirubrobacteraceae bacterium]|nr:hypothetical protein [Solirubrobacteraceae bacterium]
MATRRVRPAQGYRQIVHEFRYAVEPLPPGRLPFHRWRWELWQGAWMLAAGWCTAPAAAERALLRAASRRVHELRGVRALRPERARFLDALRPGLQARVDTGAGVCVLVPLGQVAAAS